MGCSAVCVCHIENGLSSYHGLCCAIIFYWSSSYVIYCPVGYYNTCLVWCFYNTISSGCGFLLLPPASKLSCSGVVCLFLCSGCHCPLKIEVVYSGHDMWSLPVGHGLQRHGYPCLIRSMRHLNGSFGTIWTHSSVVKIFSVNVTVCGILQL